MEYQVPTSSQRDHDDDNVIVVESDDEGGADEGEGADDEQDDPDTEGYDVETMVCSIVCNKLSDIMKYWYNNIRKHTLKVNCKVLI